MATCTVWWILHSRCFCAFPGHPILRCAQSPEQQTTRMAKPLRPLFGTPVCQCRGDFTASMLFIQYHPQLNQRRFRPTTQNASGHQQDVSPPGPRRVQRDSGGRGGRVEFALGGPLLRCRRPNPPPSVRHPHPHPSADDTHTGTGNKNARGQVDPLQSHQQGYGSLVSQQPLPANGTGWPMTAHLVGTCALPSPPTARRHFPLLCTLRVRILQPPTVVVITFFPGYG